MEDKMNQPFNITSVCRADLLNKYSEEEALKFTDAEMKTIASKMADAYCDNGFWIDLEIIAEYVKDERKEEE
jgi:hypothetical protein